MGRAERIKRLIEGVDMRKVKSPKQRAREFWLSGYTRMMLCEEITRLQDKCGEVNPPEIVEVINNDFSSKSSFPDDPEDEIVAGPLDSESGRVSQVVEVEGEVGGVD